MERPAKDTAWVNQLLTDYQWESVFRIHDKKINNILHDRWEDKFSKPKISTTQLRTVISLHLSSLWGLNNYLQFIWSAVLLVI